MATARGASAGDVFVRAIAVRNKNQAMAMLRKDPSLAKSWTQDKSLSALHVAANRSLLHLTTALVEAGADLNSKDKDGDTPLMSALIAGCGPTSEYLIKRGCDVNARNKEGQTAAHKAAIADLPRVVGALLAKEADFNVQDDNGDTPMHDCIYVTKDRLDTAKVILAWSDLNLSLANKEGHPPLHYACLHDQPGIIERILHRDKSLANSKQPSDGFTPVHCCACSKHVQCMKVLIEKGGAGVNIASTEQHYPLHLAAYQGALDCVKLLVRHGADVNGRDKLGNTPLHGAMGGIEAGEPDMLEMLLGHSNVKEEVRVRLACFLVQQGTDPEVRNNDGLLALEACPSHAKARKAVRKFITRNSSSAAKSKPSSQGGAVSQSGLCPRCSVREAEILLVPCGHRVLCRACSSDVSLCPRCGQSVQQMFDKVGRNVQK